MSSFQSAPLPLVTRLFANPVLHITVISFLVVAGTLYIIRQQQKQEIARRMEYLRGGPVFADTNKANQASNKSASAEVSAPQASPDLPPPPPPPSQAAVAADISAAGSAGARSAGFLPSNRNMATVNEPVDRSRDRSQQNRELKLKVHYVLAPRSAVARLLQEAQTHPSFVDFGDVRMGVIKNSATSLSGMDSLETIEKTAEVEGSEIIWFAGDKSVENGVGVTSKLTLLGRDNQGIRGEIEVLKAFFESRERGSGPTLKPFGPAQFELAPKSSLFLKMSLPPVAQSESATTGFMRLFQMTNFLQGQSEFVMIIDFD